MTGTFIVFEGGEGCGKSTQIQKLEGVLAAEGFEVVNLREPGGTEISEKIRQVLLHRGGVKMDPVAEMFLFLAARAQIVTEVIRPSLEKGKIVICDRFDLSTVVYQGYVRGLGRNKVAHMNRLATGGLKPDLTLLLDIDPKVGLRRAKDQNRFEAEGLKFHEKVRAAYLAEAQRDPTQVVVINASQSIAKIHHEIRNHVFTLLCSRA